MRFGMWATFPAALVLAAAAHGQQPASAVSDLKLAAQARPELKLQLDTLKAQRGSGAISVAKISAATIRAAKLGQSVQFALAPNVSVVARAIAVDTDGTRTLWRGEVAASSADLPPGLATLVISGEGVTGSIRTTDGKLFRLHPLGSGETAIVQLDYKTLPPDHPEDAPAGAVAPAKKLAPPAAKPGSLRSVKPSAKLDTPTVEARLRDNPPLLQAATKALPLAIAERYKLRKDLWRLLRPPTIDVLVAYTASAQAAAGDIVSLIDLAVTETNDSFTNSNVWASLRLVGTMPVTYNETGRSFLEMVNHLQGASDGFMDNVHAQRNSLHADIVVLIINNDAYCGRAWDISVPADGAFAVVYWGCATGYYSFGHEIAHLVGARHDRDNDPTTTPFAWGHGFRHPLTGGGWRTIMGYACNSGTCDPRLQYWSSPLTTWSGIPMGTATQEDNHRVWNERASEVAAFR
jgi:peptidyl-Asp metalloendopeptidase